MSGEAPHIAFITRREGHRPFHEAKAKLAQIEAEAKRKADRDRRDHRPGRDQAEDRPEDGRHEEGAREISRTPGPRSPQTSAAFLVTVDELGKKAKDSSAKK
jgi:hypothetical protein